MRASLSRLTGVALVAVAMRVAVPAAAPTAPAGLDHETAVHVLNRLTFGATREAVADLRARGLDAWLATQMRPAAIDDGALEQRLAALPTVALSPRELSATYILPAMQRRQEAARRQAAAADASATGDASLPSVAMSAGGEMNDTPAVGRNRMSDARQPRDVLVSLVTQKMLRVTGSERQLEEVLVDFWFNHFNVFAGKGPVRAYVSDFERRAIRPYVFGRFRDMLGAVAAHPAMLFYLDNWQSRAPGARTPRGMSGLNENYARELLELHTLGVDGGYTQQDIVEVARAFTGWTIRQPRVGGEAFFDRRRHDPGAKQVLGLTLVGGGRDDGERVLDLVARHPATARHLARKLATRFVSDTPSDALVTRLAARFTASEGDLAATVEALVRSPEFLAAEHRQTKVKTPLEFVASTLRMLEAEVSEGRVLGQELRTLGMPPYFAAPPTGYSDKADAWTNAGALVQRMNLAVALTRGRLRGVTPPRLPVVPGGESTARARAIAEALLLRTPSAATLAAVARAKSDADMAALVLGSPEFQRR